MCAVCIPYHAIGATISDSSNGANVLEPARDVGDGRPVPPVPNPDGCVRGLIQDNEVIRDG